MFTFHRRQDSAHAGEIQKTKPAQLTPTPTLFTTGNKWPPRQWQRGNSIDFIWE
jgi:hypothetical protein